MWLAITGEVLYGIGSGTTMVAMRAVVSKFFVGNELTFALVRRPAAFGSFSPQLLLLLLLLLPIADLAKSNLTYAWKGAVTCVVDKRRGMHATHRHWV